MSDLSISLVSVPLDNVEVGQCFDLRSTVCFDQAPSPDELLAIAQIEGAVLLRGLFDASSATQRGMRLEDVPRRPYPDRRTIGDISAIAPEYGASFQAVIDSLSSAGYPLNRYTIAGFKTSGEEPLLTSEPHTDEVQYTTLGHKYISTGVKGFSILVPLLHAGRFFVHEDSDCEPKDWRNQAVLRMFDYVPGDGLILRQRLPNLGPTIHSALSMPINSYPQGTSSIRKLLLLDYVNE